MVSQDTTPKSLDPVYSRATRHSFLASSLERSESGIFKEVPSRGKSGRPGVTFYLLCVCKAAPSLSDQGVVQLKSMPAYNGSHDLPQPSLGDWDAAGMDWIGPT